MSSAPGYSISAEMRAPTAQMFAAVFNAARASPAPGAGTGGIRVFSPQFSRSMLELYLNDARPDGNAQC
jgi:hypothetical protein